MATKISPFPFNKFKSYELCKQELLAWSEITDLDEHKQAILIALGLLDDNKTKIREKNFERLQLDELKQEDGLNTLIELVEFLLKMIFWTLLRNSKLLRTFLVMNNNQYLNILLQLMLNRRKLKKKWPNHQKFWHLSF